MVIIRWTSLEIDANFSGFLDTRLSADELVEEDRAGY